MSGLIKSGLTKSGLTKKQFELLHALATQHKHDCDHVHDEVNNNEILEPMLADCLDEARQLQIAVDRILCTFEAGCKKDDKQSL